MGFLAELGPVLSGLQPFGLSGLFVALLVGGLFWTRKNRFEEDKQLAGFRAESLEDMREELDRERRLRHVEERRANRYLDALRLWCGWAHDARHGRMNDRQQHISYERKAGIEPLMLPEVPQLPRLTEDDENREGERV